VWAALSRDRLALAFDDRLNQVGEDRLGAVVVDLGCPSRLVSAVGQMGCGTLSAECPKNDASASPRAVEGGAA